jgi:hypothetical protein
MKIIIFIYKIKEMKYLNEKQFLLISTLWYSINSSSSFIINYQVMNKALGFFFFCISKINWILLLIYLYMYVEI